MKPNLIKGGSHSDQRGTITFMNDFDMDQVKRFYVIEHPDTKTIRAWRGHKIEQRWFHAIQGSFLIRIVEIENWENPNTDLPIIEFKLSAKSTEVLHIPVGYASSLQALEKDSKLIVFADYDISNVEKDNYLFPEEYWGTTKN